MVLLQQEISRSTYRGSTNQVNDDDENSEWACRQGDAGKGVQAGGMQGMRKNDPYPRAAAFCTSSCNLRRVSPRQYRSTGTRTSTSPSCGSTCARRRRSYCVALSILTTEALSTPTSGKYQTNLPHLFLGATYRPFSNVSAPIFASNYSSPSPSRPPRIGSQQPSCSSRFLNKE